MSFKTAFMSFLRGEKSDAELETYRRAETQIDDLEAAVQEKAAERISAGVAAAPTNEQYAAAFAWIARGLSSTSSALLETDASEDPRTAGYLPAVTFEQAKVLYVQVPEFVQRGWEALANPNYRSDCSLPVVLGPRIEAGGACPLVHMKGIRAAAVALDGYAEVRLNEHLAADPAAASDLAPAALDVIRQRRAGGTAKLRFSEEQLTILGEGTRLPAETHEEVETRLWGALSDAFLVGQLLAKPSLVAHATAEAREGRVVAKSDRWFIAESGARKELEDTKFGEQEIKEFWTRKGWRTTPREERYLAECAALLEAGKLAVASPWSTCPFDPVYQALESVTILDRDVARLTELHLDMDDDKDVLLLGTPRFRRTKTFEEEHDEHGSDPSAG